MSLYWLASYPKSGNTWMRALLANYFVDGDEPIAINAIGGGPIASARHLFDDTFGTPASSLTQEEIDRLRPTMYEAIAATVDVADSQLRPPPIIKTHDAFTLTPDGMPMFPKGATAGAIYLLRNPIDVVPSFAHHAGLPVSDVVRRLADPDAAINESAGALRQQLLTWSDHVRSWVDEPDLRLLVLRYEDMADDTHEALRSVIGFLNQPVDEERVAKAVQFSTFTVLAGQEAQDSFDEKSSAAESFFRKGVVGDGYTSLTQAQIDQVCGDHAEIMERFGYLGQR